ncbi:MAG: hypothetical protein ACK5W9_03405 [Bdellovibrionales bacterium]
MTGRKGVAIKKYAIANRRGQVLMEGLLLMVVSLGLLGATLRYLRDDRTLDKLTNAGWSGVAQMVEYGDWPSTGQPEHPNSEARVRTLIPN